MKQALIKKIMMGLAICGLAVASYGVDVSYQGQTTGFWDVDANWNLGVAPTNDLDAKIYVQPGKTITLTNSATVKYLSLNSGDALTPDLIIDGGSLYCAGTGWNAVGYNKSAYMILRNGGSIVSDGRLDIGLLDNDTTAVCTFTMEETSGDVTITHDSGFSVGFNYDGSHTGHTARAYIEGGTIYAPNIKIDTDGHCFLDVKKSGKLVITGNHTNELNGYVADGYLLGNSAVSNTLVAYDGTNTTITALAPAIPDYTGFDLAVATNNIVADGYAVGIISTGYVRGVESGFVLEQDPDGGTKGVTNLTPVDLVIQEVAPGAVANISWTGGTGSWTNGANWTGGVAPLRETQWLKANVVNSTPCALDSAVGVAHLVINGGNVTLASGADLYAGKKPGGTEWTGIGYNQPSTLTIESNAVLQTAAHILLGFLATTTPGESRIEINGGTLDVSTTINLGNDTFNGDSWGVINVRSNGLLTAGNLNFKNYNDGDGTNSVINIYDGTLELDGNKTNDVNAWIGSTNIVILGSASTLEYSGISTILTVTNPEYGFAGWATGWGVDIGSETNDHDEDLVNNLYEYALNGDPIDDQDTGQKPVLVNNGGAMEYTHLLRADDTNLVYTVETKNDLVLDTWTNIGSIVSGTDVTGGDYNTVTNLINTIDPQTFIRLKIENP